MQSMDTMKDILFCLILVTSYSRYEGSKICKTQTCISVADQFIEFMNPAVDPCEDFNQFACGGYLDKYEDDANTWDEAAKQMRARVENIIKIKKQRDEDFQVDQKVRDFFRACEKFQENIGNSRNANAIETQLANQTKQTMINVGLKGWPYSDNTFKTEMSRWYDVIPKMIEQGIVYTDGRIELPIINVDVGVNEFTKNESTLKIGSPDFDEWDGNYWSSSIQTLEDSDYYMDLHYDRPKELLKFIDPTGSSTTLGDKLLDRSIEIDEALYRISTYTNRHHKGDRDYGLGRYLKYSGTQSTLSNLTALPCGSKPFKCNPPTWNDFIDDIIVATGNKNIRTGINQTVIIKDHRYFEQLDKVFETLDIEPYEMANYLGWKIMVDYIVGARNLESSFGGECVNYLIRGYDNKFTEEGLLNIAVGSMYAREFFGAKKKVDVLTLVNYIRKTFEILVPHITWMDEETIANAIEKLQGMGQFIAFPDELLNRSIMDQYYKGNIVYQFSSGNMRYIIEIIYFSAYIFLH